MTKTDALRVLFQTSRLGIELDDGLTVHTTTSSGRVTGIEICGRAETVSIPMSAVDDLIAVLQAVKEG